MPAQLVALSEGPNILLDKPVLLLGRHPECDIQIDSRKISRRHCCIAQVEDHLVVRDLTPHYGPDCPVAVVYRVGWPDQQVIRGTLATIRTAVKASKITRTALIRPYVMFTRLDVVGVVVAPPKRDPHDAVLPSRPSASPPGS